MYFKYKIHMYFKYVFQILVFEILPSTDDDDDWWWIYGKWYKTEVTTEMLSDSLPMSSIDCQGYLNHFIMYIPFEAEYLGRRRM